jgi:hypothetical protein
MCKAKSSLRIAEMPRSVAAKLSIADVLRVNGPDSGCSCSPAAASKMCASVGGNLSKRSVMSSAEGRFGRLLSLSRPASGDDRQGRIWNRTFGPQSPPRLAATVRIARNPGTVTEPPRNQGFAIARGRRVVSVQMPSKHMERLAVG